MVPSENSWIDDGVMGVVRSITPPRPNAQKKYWKCVLADTVGSAKINLTVFTAPRFSEGDQIEIVGKGIKRKEYNGEAEIGLGKTSEIHVIGHSVHHEEQQARAAEGQPALNGQLQPIHGQTVGMALKLALDLLTRDVEAAGLHATLNNQDFWKLVHVVSSDIIRVSAMIEHGKLAPSIKDRLNPPAKTNGVSAAHPAAQPAPAPRQVARPSEAQMANRADSAGREIPVDEDLPF